ncbi:MAG: hypothetical protein E6J53_08745 [Chloroflexi bacterium]|nr:MAG: hypothetical protein E6J53_08745 [Chloroflexota bacterium]
MAAGMVLLMFATACARTPSTSASGAKPIDLYAAEPSPADVKSMLGDSNWWPGPPSFGVRPLDSASMPMAERFRILQRFVHIGTAETFDVEFIQWTSASTATTQMNNIKSALGTSASGASVGDQSLYYGLQGTGGAPFQTATFVRVGAVMTTITLSMKDAYPKLDLLGKIANRVVSRLKNALTGKVHGNALASTDESRLPPKGPDMTLLGAVKLPVEAVIVMLNFAAPETLSGLLRSAGADSIVFGDYALDNDTHMEMRAGVLEFNSTQKATDWIDALRGNATIDSNGIASFYDPSTGQYFSLFTAGAKGAMLVCRSVADGEAASRSCEVPMSRVAPAWQFSLNAQ